MEARSLFHVQLEPGQTKFQVPRPPACKGNRNVKYSFECIRLTPDFYSRQATLYKMDPALEEAINYEAKFTFNYFDTFYNGTEYTLFSQTKKIGDLVQSINSHFDTFKPTGQKSAPFFIDWEYPGANSTELSEVEFYQASAILFYNENYDETKHWNGLPESARNIEGANNFLFPTTSDRDLLSQILLRLWIAPNTTVSFSSDNILHALGMKALGPRGKMNRYQFENDSSTEYRCVNIWDAPELQIIPGSSRSKIYLSPTADQIGSYPFRLSTTRQREINNGHLAEDLNKTLSLEAAKHNISFGLKFEESEKTFKFAFPENPGLKIVIKLQVPLVYRLGYGLRERIRKEDEASPMATDVNQELDKKARTLVFDTGMTIITMDNTGNNYTLGFNDEMMSVLYPKDPGVLESHPNVRPDIYPPNTGTNELTFSIWRFSENCSPIPISWNTGGYLDGVLVGIV
jgi:hypothetical protein